MSEFFLFPFILKMAVYKHYGKLKKMSNQFETEKKMLYLIVCHFLIVFSHYEKIYFLLNGFFFNGVLNFVDLIFTLYFDIYWNAILFFK